MSYSSRLSPASLVLALSAFAMTLTAQTPAAILEPEPALDPAVSADGRLLAFSSPRDGAGFWHIRVRPLAGGESRPITTGAHDDSEPDFSPDGRTLAYRSEARGGGIWLVPATGGKPRLFAAGGRRPRFSPDGRRILYWSEAADGQARVWMRETNGGAARAFHPEFHTAQEPAWSPDGTRVIFRGCRDGSAANCDWWVSPADGGDAVAAGAAKAFAAARFEGVPGPGVWMAGQNEVAFAAKVGENTRLWSIALDAGSGKAAGAPRRLTRGEADERSPAVTPDGRVLFASRTQNIDIWSLPLDANGARPKGRPVRLTSDASADQRPSLSRDGRRVAWETTRGGNFEVWVKDLVSGKEHGITSGPLREHMPALSPDGARLVYDAHDGEKVTIYESAFGGGEAARIREENVGQGSFQWTESGRVLYFHRKPPGTVGLLDLASGAQTVLLRHAGFNLSLADARLSPDGGRIVFPVPFAAHRSRLAVARLTGSPVEREENWTYILPEEGNSSQPEWSPNGEWVYFLWERGGRMAVWARRVGRGAAAGAQATGSARAIWEFGGMGPSIAEMRPRDIGLAVARDKLALGAATYSGSIWGVGR